VRGYRHKTFIRVRNYEVDWQGIVHNSIYLQYFETGRFEYLRSVGYQLDMISVREHARVVLARNEIDYLHPARFDDMLEVYTRISKIGITSYVFEGLMRNIETKNYIAKNRAVHVWLTPVKGRPRKLPGEFVRRIERFEGRPIPRKLR
jgi:acyl-CoA thioester hydrolase